MLRLDIVRLVLGFGHSYHLCLVLQWSSLAKTSQDHKSDRTVQIGDTVSAEIDYIDHDREAEIWQWVPWNPEHGGRKPQR
jgi:exosome complex RNA-binding protein Rrp4